MKKIGIIFAIFILTIHNGSNSMYSIIDWIQEDTSDRYRPYGGVNVLTFTPYLGEIAGKAVVLTLVSPIVLALLAKDRISNFAINHPNLTSFGSILDLIKYKTGIQNWQDKRKEKAKQKAQDASNSQLIDSVKNANQQGVEKSFSNTVPAQVNYNDDEAFKIAINGAATDKNKEANYFRIIARLLKEYPFQQIPLNSDILLLAIEKNQPAIAQKIIVATTKQSKGSEKIYLNSLLDQATIRKILGYAVQGGLKKLSTRSSYLNLIKAYLEKLEPAVAQNLVTDFLNKNTLSDEEILKILNPYKKQ